MHWIERVASSRAQSGRRPALGLTACLGAVILLLAGARGAFAAGVVTDCTQPGPGPGTLLSALKDGGLIAFACSGTIPIPEQIGINYDTVLDATGYHVELQGDGDNRLFDVGIPDSQGTVKFEIRHLVLTNGNGGDSGGGAITNYGDTTIIQSAVLSNTARYGGAIDHRKGTLLIVNSILAGNSATGIDDGGGGAIDQFNNDNAQTIIVHSALVGNVAPNVDGRDGLWLERGTAKLINSILDRNGAAGKTSANCVVERAPGAIQQPTLEIIGANLSSDGSCPGLAPVDPKLGPLGRYRSLTPTYALPPDSPAIDAVAPGLCSAGVDQRGLVRPLDGNLDGEARCDAGPYEYGTRFLVRAANTNGLAGYWRMDGSNGGAIVDSSGNGRTATIAGEATFTTTHPVLHFDAPYALQLSGVGQYAEVPGAMAPAGATGLTLAAWVRLESSDTDQTILGNAAAWPAGPGYYLGISQGQLTGAVWDTTGTPYMIAAGTVPTSTWAHVAFTWQVNGTMATYVNGRQVNLPQATGANPIAVSPAPLRMGAAPWDPAQNTLRGVLDEVRIYEQVLTADQIVALAGGRGCVSGGGAWTDAMPDLQCALVETAPGGEVWIAAGRYTPTGSSVRTATFRIGEGLSIYGGFEGTETAVTQRDVHAHHTVLSGDIDFNDQVDADGVLWRAEAIAGTNAYHVVTLAGGQMGITLDGVTITGGRADGPTGANCDMDCGGGIWVEGDRVVLRNLELLGNHANSKGGGLYQVSGVTSLVDGLFGGNQANHGGALYTELGELTLVNVALSGNRAGAEGGGLYLASGTPRLTNLSAGGNLAGNRGGALYIDAGGPVIANSVFGNNTAPTGPQVHVNGGAGASIDHTLVQDGCPAGAACSSLLSGDPLFAMTTTVPATRTALLLQPASPAIDMGDNNATLGSALPGGTIASIAEDLAGRPRVLAARMPGPIIDLGAYEAANQPPVFTSSPLTSTTATATYSYTFSVIDPNQPEVTNLPVTVKQAPEWLKLVTPAAGVFQLIGTPVREQAGDWPVVIEVTDPLGATTRQEFVVTVLKRIDLYYLPLVRR